DRLRIGPRLKQTLRYYAGALKLWLRSSFSFYMLLGIFLWRLGVFRDTERHRRLFVSVLAVSLPIGLGIAIFGHYAAQSWNLTQFGLGEYPTALFHILSWPLGIIGNLGMTLTYIAGIALLIQHKLWSRVLGIFAPVGRMALTNYALQGLLPGLVFGTYLIGLPRLRLAFLAHAAVLLTIFGFQILFSRAWLRGYRLGPLEWLWRSLTYWKCQPMRLERSDQAHYEW
ncbi:MAG: DUF418 domain-containing protein, partial [Candidatus Aminicenantes bacterium]|nr:DUF418 domain-containing protein [Candidatus Aminicenantes bacterium]